MDKLINIDGKDYSVGSFRKILIQEGNVYICNQELGIVFMIDIDDQELMEKLSINECNIQQIRVQLNRLSETKRCVPEGYENKYCALFSGRVFHSFDTREELEDFRNGPKNIGLNYTFYYAS